MKIRNNNNVDNNAYLYVIKAFYLTTIDNLFPMLETVMLKDFRIVRFIRWFSFFNNFPFYKIKNERKEYATCSYTSYKASNLATTILFA